MKKITILISILLFSSFSMAFDHDHKAFTALLTTHVKMSADQTSSAVDYKNFDKASLKKYLASASALTKKEFKTFTKEQQLVFFINTYNAYTIKLILDNYPIASIKKIGYFFSSPWKKSFFKLFGKSSYLDQIEHELVRASKILGTDARVHFAFNCASIGCPALLNTAWTPEKVRTQLDTASKNFLKDHSRNRVNLKDKSVELSNIFKWYADDFKTKNYKSIKEFLITYVDSITRNEKEKALILSGKYSVSYSGYNWDLNKL